MASAALANIAAATSAGYKEIVLDRGASFSPAAYRFEVTLELFVTGEPNVEANIPIRAFGQGSSQANAETVALAALNGQRLNRYGADTGATSKGPKGNQLVRDVT